MAGVVETVAEPAKGPRGVAEREPEDFGISIGQGAFGDFPDGVGDFGGFVHNEENAFALVVKARERGGVLLGPRDLIDTPCAFARGIPAQQSRGGELVVFAAEEEVEPLAKLSPGFGFKLCFGVGGDYPAGVRGGGESPENEPADQRGLADAVAGSSGDFDRVVEGDKTSAYVVKDLNLP